MKCPLIWGYNLTRWIWEELEDQCSRNLRHFLALIMQMVDGNIPNDSNDIGKLSLCTWNFLGP